MGHHFPQKVSNISREQGSDVPFHDFAGYDGIATTAEKTAAERGAQARGTYGAKRDRCKKGKSCGAACIFYRKDCVLDLPESASVAMTSLRNYLTGEMRRGNITEREAHRKFLQATGLDKVKDKRANLDKDRISATSRLDVKEKVKKADIVNKREKLREGLNKLREEVPNRSERSKLLRETAKDVFDFTYGQQSAPRTSIEQLNALASPKSQERVDRMQDVMTRLQKGELTQEQYNRAMAEAKTVNLSRSKATDGQVLVAEALLSPTAQNYLLRAGKVTSPNVYEEDFPTSLSIPRGSEVGKSVDVQQKWLRSNVRELLESKFIDPYTGLRLNVLQADMEHMVPEKVAKPFGVANVGGNKAFTGSHINQSKSEHPISFLSIKNPNGIFKGLKFDSNGRVTEESYNAKNTSKMGKETFLQQIKQKSIPVASILKMIAAIPASDLKAQDRASLIGHIVRTWTNAPSGVTIGPSGRGQVAFRWYGDKDQGWSATKAKNLGNKMAEAISRWEGQGDAGSAKIMALAGRMNAIQQRLLAINDMSFQGTTPRQVEIKGDMRKFVNSQFEKILGEEEKDLLSFLGS